MQREYVAFVEGRAPNRAGTWRHRLQLSHDQMRQEVAPPGKAGSGPGAQEAVTHYEVVAEYSLAGGKRFASQLRLRLETGLKHQIRVQAAQAGLPLIGDRTYNPNWRPVGGAAHGLEFSRQALHSELLTLDHPQIPGKRMTWRADLPKDLRQLEAALRQGKI